MVLLGRVFCATFCATAENSAAEEDRDVSSSAAAEDDVGSGGGHKRTVINDRLRPKHPVANGRAVSSGSVYMD